MTDSTAVLRDYVDKGSEDAFAQVVAEHVDLVYSTALRIVHSDTFLARDVAQVVFTDLARKAKSLSSRVILGGWLYRHTCFLAANALRTERRRQIREREAVAMHALESDEGTAWRELAPVLDEAMGQLRPHDRDALVLRFFQQKPLRAVGQAFGISEEAARKRVDRAIDALRGHLLRKGVTLSATSLITLLGAGAVTAAPSGLAAALTSVSLANAGSSAAGFMSVLELFSVTKLQIAAVSCLFAAGLATSMLLGSQAEAYPKTAPKTGISPQGRSASQLANGPPAPSSAHASPSPALATLEAWLHHIDQTNPSAAGIDDELRFRIWSLTASDYPLAWRLHEGLQSVNVRGRFKGELLGFWSRLDPLAALRVAESIPKGNSSPDAVGWVLWNWGEKDPEAALAWARASIPKDRQSYRLAEALEGMARKNPLSALQSAPALLPAGLQRLATQRIIHQWSDQDPAAAARYVEGLPASRQRTEAFEIVARNWVEADPEAAMAWAQGLPHRGGPDSIMDEVFRKWLVLDPQAAGDWVEQANLPDPIKRKFRSQ